MDQKQNFPQNISAQPLRSKRITVAAVILTAALLYGMLVCVGNPSKAAQSQASNAGIMDKYDMYITNQTSDALDGVLSIEKVYWLNDDDLVAPEPNQACFGETDDPDELRQVLEKAADLLQGQELYFDPDTELFYGSKVNYYLDETIFAVTWKEVHDACVYTYSEVKIAHASQFRRFLAGGEYGSEKQFITTEMAASVNAVVASSGDFYRFRNYGTIVYDGKVQRINSAHIDTCFIDDQGDLHLVPKNTLTELEEAQKFVDENNIRFSVAFGPILVEDGQRCEPHYYALGEIYGEYPRAALCQMGELHYLLVAANDEIWYQQTPDIHAFARNVQATGCEKAYTLDGGQTAAIVMNDELINHVLFGFQRKISDIIYFATAVPDGG